MKIQFSKEDRAWILDKIDQTLAKGSLSLGPLTQEFEGDFARMCGVTHAVATSSGTSALEIIFRVLSLQEKEILIPTNTFFATPAAALHAGCKVRFIDMSPASLAPTPEMIERAITPNTKAVVIVHIGGNITADMPAIQALCKRKDIDLIEDAAHAHGSSLDKAMAGSLSDVAAFSFYPTKVMTSGEGGMIVTNRKFIAEEAQLFRDQGKEGPATNRHSRMGYNWRMSDVHAAIGIRHLSHLAAFVEERQKLAENYAKLLDHDLLSCVLPARNCSANFYKFIVMPQRSLRPRQALKRSLNETHNVRLPGEVYELPCHLQPVFANHPDCFFEPSLTYARQFCETHLCLPIYQGLSYEEQAYVVERISKELSRE